MRKASGPQLLSTPDLNSSIEQEQLIHDLQTKDAQVNELYRLIFSILPLTVILPFVYYLSFTSRSTTLLCIMAMTSLVSTAYTMWYIPFQHTTAGLGRAGLNLEDGPLDQFLPYLNPIISLFLCLAAWRLKQQERGPEGLWLFLLMPSALLVMVTVVRRSIVDVQTGIGELSGMKYHYRGA